MTESDNKYHKLLEYAQSLGFNEGNYVKICNALKACKDKDKEPEMFKTESLYGVVVRFIIDKKSHKIKYIYKFKQLDYYKNSEQKYRYTVSRGVFTDDESELDMIVTEYYHTSTDTLISFFNKLRYAKDIEIDYSTPDNTGDFDIQFDNLGALKRHFNKLNQQACEYCAEDSDKDPEECPSGNDHGDFRSTYYFLNMLNIEY